MSKTKHTLSCRIKNCDGSICWKRYDRSGSKLPSHEDILQIFKHVLAAICEKVDRVAEVDRAFAIVETVYQRIQS